MNSWYKKLLSDQGEKFVWLSAMGLTVGIIMITSLIVLVLVRGLTVFWPKDITYFEFTADYDNWQRGDILAGIVADRETDVHHSIQSDAAADTELKLYIANRIYNNSQFIWVPENAVRMISKPDNIFSVHTLDMGELFVKPLKLVYNNGTEVLSNSPGFQKQLSQSLRENNALREEISRIERGALSRINKELLDIQLELRRLELDQDFSEAEIERIRSELSERLILANQQNERIQQQILELRESLNRIRFEFEVQHDRQDSISLGDIVQIYNPNRMNPVQKLGVFIVSLWDFLSEFPRAANMEGGIFPTIVGTFVMTVLMSILVTPVGVMAAVYLHEYARNNLFFRLIRTSVSNLAGVPSIVFGVFGLSFFVYFLGGGIDNIFFQDKAALNIPTFGTGGILWASFTLALMTTPVVIVATEEALSSVPSGIKEASAACGASKWQTIRKILLPAARPGILTGLILATARGAGEVAPLMFVGVIKLAPSLPIDGEFPFVHLDRKFMHMGFHIFDLAFQSPDSEAALPMAFATTLLLLLLVILMNFVAILFRNRLRHAYDQDTF